MMVTQSEPRPTLVLNPPDDQDFRARAIGLVDGGVLGPTKLEEALRRTFPDAIVRPRELAGERTSIWYVYREGHWVRPGS